MVKMPNVALSMGRLAVKDLACLVLESTVLLSYSITGNLSANFKSRLERFWPGYDARTASVISYYTNAAAYGVTTSLLVLKLTGIGGGMATVSGFAASLIYGLGEAEVRENTNRNAASLVGVILSQPVEYAFRLYDRAKAERMDKQKSQS